MYQLTRIHLDIFTIPALFRDARNLLIKGFNDDEYDIFALIIIILDYKYFTKNIITNNNNDINNNANNIDENNNDSNNNINQNTSAATTTSIRFFYICVIRNDKMPHRYKQRNIFL